MLPSLNGYGLSRRGRHRRVNQEHGAITEQVLKDSLLTDIPRCAWPQQVDYGRGDSLKVNEGSLKLQYREGA